MVAVELFNCAELADGCSSCLSSLFDCGWCDRAAGMTDSCTFSGQCDATPVSMATGCPDPMVTDFNPMSGPSQGGTTIIITGRELGVNFTDASITVGGVTCTTTNPDSYIPGRQISCITGQIGSAGSRTLLVTTLAGSGTLDTQFQYVDPQVSGVVPGLGPLAGGTRLTVSGSDLNVGNTENTRVTLVDGTVCEVE